MGLRWVCMSEDYQSHLLTRLKLMSGLTELGQGWYYKLLVNQAGRHLKLNFT